MMLKFLISLFALSLTLLAFSCSDMGNQPPKLALSASQYSVTLLPGASASLTISGGNPPYSLVHQPSAQLATSNLVNNANGTATLNIVATSALVSGRDSVVITDADDHGGSDSPTHSESEITIHVLINPPSGTVFFSAQVQPIFSANCTGCHSAGGSAPFSLQNGVSRENLVNVQATSSCTSDMRVLPGSSTTSVLYKKIAGTSCGTRMPMGRAPLSQSDIDLIRDWIDQGAQNN